MCEHSATAAEIAAYGMCEDCWCARQPARKPRLIALQQEQAEKEWAEKRSRAQSRRHALARKTHHAAPGTTIPAKGTDTRLETVGDAQAKPSEPAWTVGDAQAQAEEPAQSKEG